MRLLLLYYTGTFNTRYLTGMVKERFVKEGYEVDVKEIDPRKVERLDFTPYDLLGLGYPIYGFNAPWPFLKFIRAQKFKKGLKAFIYKNSGETYHANDASSVSVARKLRRCGVKLTNEYHFIFPYNIHFRFDEQLVHEMLQQDDRLLDILVKEVTTGIPNIKKYKFIHRFITQCVKLQFIGGPVNSFLMKVDKKSCINCNLCIKQCPVDNIYRNKKGDIDFHHRCLMCMRCSLFCPKDAVRVGFLEGWRVNGPYNFAKIRAMEDKPSQIKENTQGFFSCYKETYANIDKRHKELFGE